MSKWMSRKSVTRFKRKIKNSLEGTKVFHQEQTGSYPVTDKSALKEKIDSVEALIVAGDLVEDDYTPESWLVLMNSLSMGKVVLSDVWATQDSVDQATKSIVDAVEGLVPRVKCVYPLDATDDLLDFFGTKGFDSKGDCGHVLEKVRGTDNEGNPIAALDKKVIERFIKGLLPEDSQVFPPKDFEISAVEYNIYLRVDDTTQNPPHETGIYFGGLDGNTFETFGFGILVYENSIELRAALADGTWIWLRNRIRIPNEVDLTLRVGLYYNTTLEKFGVIVSDFYGEELTDYGYVGDFTNQQMNVFAASMPMVVNPNVESKIEVFTKGEDLQFFYPSNTKGLDGEPAPVSPEPPKPKPITNSITVIPVARPDNLTTVQYYVGDMEADPDPIGVLVDESGWSLGKVKLVGSVYTPEGSNPYINTIRVLMDPDEQVPTRYDLKINDKLIPASAKHIQPTATPNMLSFLTIMENQEDLFETEVQYTVEVLAYYD